MDNVRKGIIVKIIISVNYVKKINMKAQNVTRDIQKNVTISVNFIGVIFFKCSYRHISPPTNKEIQEL